MKAWGHALKNGLIIGLLVISSSSWGQITVFGGSDCGRWVKGDAVTKIWLMGFLSGMNIAMTSQGKPDQLAKINSGEQAILWMDNYCKANPLKVVGDGAQELFIELSKK